MENKRILVTGGTGRLGKYIIPLLQDHFEVTPVGIENFDFIYQVPKGEYDLVLHMGAYTSVVQAESEKHKCFLTNVVGTYNLVNTYKDIPFIYISTEYANKPLGVYALSKQLGEEVVKTHPHHLILRTSFKPDVWPFPFAYENQMTRGDSTSIIAKVLTDAVVNWDKETSEMIHAGTERKSILELARRSRPDVVPNRVEDYNNKIGMNLIPYDYE